MKLERYITLNKQNLKGIQMTRKVKVGISPTPKLEYAKLMVDEDYTNKQIQDISDACSMVISRWKKHYKAE